MRRIVHSLLVGLLALSLSIDAVRACGQLRHWHHCPPARAGAVMIVAVDGGGWCCPVEPACEEVACGCCDMAVVPPAADVCDCCGAPPAGLDATSVVVAAPVGPARPDAIGGAVVSESVPALAPAPTPAEPVPTPAPIHDPGDPASASQSPAIKTEPAAEPTVEQPAAPTVTPAARNAFEEADAALAPDLDGAEPAAAPDQPPESAPAPAAEPRAALEPLRRWIDDTAAYAVVGRLVDVRGERVRILRADGRSVTVPLARLSGLDRRYVAGAAVRTAAARSPQTTDTAGR